MGKALYRKYRSKSLDEIVGQSHITSVLKRAIEQGRVAHAYLLTGPRGVGKTSIARILAHEINNLPYKEQGSHLDIIEIDAASNNGVEDVRDLREKVNLAPVSAAKKVYIIDEVHMLSKPAFNALLKTLEEPPEHIVFILATTDVEKLPATIVSRTQQFSFRPIAQAAIVSHLGTIAKEEGINIDETALELIALRSGGSFRDGISLLDQLASLADKKQGITAQLVEETLGLASEHIVTQLIDAHQKKDLEAIVRLLDEALQSGVSATTLTDQLIQQLRRIVASKPRLLPLLTALLDVPSSLHPDIKLLTVLAAHAEAKPRSAPLLAGPTPVIRASIKELEEKATQKTPAEEPVVKKKPSTKKSQATAPFDWNQLVSYTKEHYVAIYSVLSKCSPDVEDGVLTLYTVNAFYKKKLDDAKYRSKLMASLEELGCGELIINTIPTTCPPKDEQAAKVAAIMGGGEEVSL